MAVKTAADPFVEKLMTAQTQASPLEELRAIMARLRDPDRGCEWDVQQNFATIAPYTIEEAYEVADAIERQDMGDLKSELGDLLLQVIFHARMAEEAGLFDLDDVAATINDKMRRRHPHIFADAPVRPAWEDMKAEERRSEADPSALAGVAKALPALMVAEKLQKRAARTGFDWPSVDGALDKVREEIAELEAAHTQDEREEEYGDLLFALVNISRHIKVDPEVALRRANAKFEKRFRAMERQVGEEAFRSLDLAAQDALWQAVKRA